ncbi:MAG: class I SAM-dependent methyltransferase [Chthoniobacterales bacterium]
MKTTEKTSSWDISFLSNQDVLRTKSFGMTKEAKSVDFPVRLLRYWFGFHLLREEYERFGAPIRVAEIGVDSGQMLRFARMASQRGGCNRFEFERWLAVDAILQEERLKEAGYEHFFKLDLEAKKFALDGLYDTAVCLHVLEHLHDPENTIIQLAKTIKPGGSIIGGFPVLPNFLIQTRERQVRKTARPMGHVSIFSPKRVSFMAENAGLRLEFASGAFFMRSKGSKLENSPAWLRFNLLWGALCPGWPGEIYWLMRKPK